VYLYVWFLLSIHTINVEVSDLTKKVDNIFTFVFSTFNFLFTFFSKLATNSNEKSNHILTLEMPKSDFSFFFMHLHLHLENCYISCDHFLYHFFPFPIGEVVFNFLYFSPKASIMVLMCVVKVDIYGYETLLSTFTSCNTPW